MRAWAMGIVIAAWLSIGLGASVHAAPDVQETTPPIHGFFAKYVDCDGIPVRSSAAVKERALQLACDKVTLMLKDIPSVKDTLMRRGAELHIIGRNEQTSDLPEFRDQRGRVYVDNRGQATTIDIRTRGKGGLFASCGEENLLHLPNDRYRGGLDICVHEFSHTIMDYGFGPQQRQRIKEQYARAWRKAWAKAYAAMNPAEYWAELSMWYFGAHGDRRMNGTPPGDGPEGLRAYDPDGYFLLDQLYRGNG